MPVRVCRTGSYARPMVRPPNGTPAQWYAHPMVRPPAATGPGGLSAWISRIGLGLLSSPSSPRWGWGERPPSTPVPQPAAAPGRNWEQVLVENWLVWLGGATIALGGAFFVKLSIDYGLLTPLVRVVLGVLLGIALSVAAEWVKRHDELIEAALE